MSESKLLVVIGATGQQGGSVAKVFQSEPGWRIRGITRNPSKPTNKPLSDAGVELVAGDLDDPASLDHAFTGADAIFSVTDFWQFLQPISTSTFIEAQQSGRQSNVVAMDKEVQQGKNIIDAAARAHTQKPLLRFVVSTLADTKKWSKGELQWNLHFDGKAQYVDYLKVAHPELAKQSSYIQIGYYLANWRMQDAFKPRKPDTPGGEYLLSTTALANGKPVPYVNPPNDTGHFVRALILSPQSPPGTTMLGYNTLITAEEYAKLWAQTLNLKARSLPLTHADMVAAGAPDWLATEVTQSGAFISTYGWDGGEPGVKSPAEGGVDVSKLTELKTWFQEEDWSSIL